MFLKKFFGIFILLAIVFSPTNFLEAAGKQKVAVIPFLDQSPRRNISADENKFNDAMDLVMNTINQQATQYEAVLRDPKSFLQLLDNQKLEHNGDFDLATVANFGKKVGANYVLLGSVTALGKRGNDIIAHLSLRMVEVETAIIVYSGRGKGKSKYDELEALENAAEDALNGKMGMLTMMKNKGK